jgi:hypothetical protein|tara:strand:- start:1414 stop:1629 length:216 start_codon:yes stop_codon:yes gene_type:complete
MCLASFAAKNVPNKIRPPLPLGPETASRLDDPLKIKGVGSAASQSPAVKAATTQAKKTKPVNSALQVGTPY